MEFNDHKPIYLQIADFLCERILCGEWKEEERIPSVRELGIDLGVNPNTIMRSYDFLQSMNVIYNKRGIGYFVSQEAIVNIKNEMRERFINEDLQEVFKKMDLLEISIEEFEHLFTKFKTTIK